MCRRPLRNRRLRSPTSGLMRCSDWAEVEWPSRGSRCDSACRYAVALAELGLFDKINVFQYLDG